MDWFKGCATVDRIKREYRRLAKLHHPDLGGDNETMKSINAAYHAALKALDGHESVGSDGATHTYYYRAHVEQAVMDKIMQVLGLKLQGVTVELVGTWLWVHGDTKPVKDALKGAGMRWHAKRLMWYWHGPQGRTRYSGVPFDKLRDMYGARAFEADSQSVGMATA